MTRAGGKREPSVLAALHRAGLVSGANECQGRRRDRKRLMVLAPQSDPSDTMPLYQYRLNGRRKALLTDTDVAEWIGRNHLGEVEIGRVLSGLESKLAELRGEDERGSGAAVAPLLIYNLAVIHELLQASSSAESSPS